MSRVSIWLKATRPAFLTGSVMPVVVGGALVWGEQGHLLWGYWLLTALGMAFLHAAANLANDYYDHLSGNDEINEDYAHPFTGGSRVIQDGLMTPRAVLVAALVCMAAAAAIGLYLTAARGPVVLILGLIGALTGFFYTAKPFQLGYRGWGELCIFMDFGVFPVLGTYYVQTLHLSWQAFWISLPAAWLIMAVLWINQFQDFEADRKVNKRHWVVRIGLERAVYVYGVMVWLAFATLALSLPAAHISGSTYHISGWTYLGFLTLPLGLRAVSTALANYTNPHELTPANADTIALHLSMNALIALGLVLGRIL